MFHCAGGHMTEPGVPMTLLPVEVRMVTTTHQQVDERGKPITDPVVGRGMETAREAAFCPNCAASAPEPRVVGKKEVSHNYR